MLSYSIFMQLKGAAMTKWQLSQKQESIRITVQAFNTCDGSYREVTANIKANSEQDAIDKLWAISKDEIAYKFLGQYGYLTPSKLDQPAITLPEHWGASGEWFIKA